MITVLTSQNKNACDIYDSAIQSGATATNYGLFCLYGQDHSDVNFDYMNDEPGVYNHQMLIVQKGIKLRRLCFTVTYIIHLIIINHFRQQNLKSWIKPISKKSEINHMLHSYCIYVNFNRKN